MKLLKKQPLRLSFDLTNAEKIKDAVSNAPSIFSKILKGYTYPLGAISRLTDAVAGFLKSNEKMIQEQRQTAVEIIRAGRENGAGLLY